MLFYMSDSFMSLPWVPWFNNPDRQVSSHLMPFLKIVSSASCKINSLMHIKNQQKIPSRENVVMWYTWPISTITCGKLTDTIQRDINLTIAGESQLISLGLLTSPAHFFHMYSDCLHCRQVKTAAIYSDMAEITS